MRQPESLRNSRPTTRGVKRATVQLSRPFTLKKDINKDDPTIKKIMEQDYKGLKTPLELMKRYADVLNKSSSYGNIDKKLDALFINGKTPRTLDGFYHGITLGMKTGIDSKLDWFTKTLKKLGLAKKIDPLQVFYGRILSKTSPWAGKNFKKIDSKKIMDLTDGLDSGKRTSYLGINSFRKDNKKVINNVSGRILSTIISMDKVPKPENPQRSWIFAKGGFFIAKRQNSVDPKNPENKVMALNYRWKSLGNKFPNKLLVDEIMEIAKGLYLGKLYYATDAARALNDFDPRVQNKSYKYRNFGYFLLMDDSWLHEKNMLFPDLTYKLDDELPEKFSTLRCVNTPKTRAIKKKVGNEKTVLHYLQRLSKGVEEGAATEDKYFKEMHNLFMCGERPDGIEGFFHGGAVALKRGGFLKNFSTNVPNDIYPVLRLFSPWTGKTFTHTSLQGIKKYIGKDADYYKDKEPVILGTNTYRRDMDLSLPATAFIENLDKIGMVVEYPDAKEKDEDIYVKSFYFIANFAESVTSESKGKEVLQFNYRWPKFNTMPPDNLCIDELVRIADGLYLGQLLYSTRPKLKYDSDKPHSAYKYENFGYFMLMDDEWKAIKEFMAYDTI